MGNRSTLNVEVMKRGTRLLAARYGHLANTPVHRGLGLEQRRFVQNFAWETSSNCSRRNPKRCILHGRQTARKWTSARGMSGLRLVSSIYPRCIGSGRDPRQVIVAGLMAPCLCIESVLPDQANRMEPALYAQGLGPLGLRKVSEHYST
jgi:hypothetical protein